MKAYLTGGPVVSWSMKTPADRVKALLKARGVKDRQLKPELARVCGVSYQSTREWFTGDTKKIGADHLAKIGREWRARLEWLVDGTGDMEMSGSSSDSVKPEGHIWDAREDNSGPSTRAASRLPLIPWERIAMLDNGIEPQALGEMQDWPAEAGPGAFLMVVETDAMLSPDGRGFIRGDRIQIEPSRAPKHGSAVLVRMPDGMVLLRRYCVSSEGVSLEASNPAWPDRIVRLPAEAKILGVIVRTIREEE